MGFAKSRSTSRPSSSAPSRTAAPPSYQKPAATTPAPTKPAAPPAPQQAAPSQAPGLFQNIATAAAGSFIGSSISRAMFGSFGGPSTPEEAKEAQQNDPCYNMSSDFMTCLTQNKGDIAQCQWNFDSLQQCRTNQDAKM